MFMYILLFFADYIRQTHQGLMMAKLNKITTKCWAQAPENLWVAPLPKLEAPIQAPTTITMASRTPT